MDHPPYRAALLHGGPGAPGEMAPVARRLSSRAGILEPMQSALTVDGQVEELRALLQEHADLPVVLAGWSWGAWLAYIFTARYPGMVKKLVLVASPPFEEGYAAEVMRTRLERLDVAKRAEALALMGTMEKPGGKRPRPGPRTVRGTDARGRLVRPAAPGGGRYRPARTR